MWKILLIIIDILLLIYIFMNYARGNRENMSSLIVGTSVLTVISLKSCFNRIKNYTEDARSYLPAHPNCRCNYSPYIPTDTVLPKTPLKNPRFMSNPNLNQNELRDVFEDEVMYSIILKCVV